MQPSLLAHTPRAIMGCQEVGQGPGMGSEGAEMETQSCGAEDLLPPPGDAGEEPRAPGALLCARARQDMGGPGLAPQSNFGAPNSTAGSGCPRWRSRGMLRARARGWHQPGLSGGSSSVLARWARMLPGASSTCPRACGGCWDPGANRDPTPMLSAVSAGDAPHGAGAVTVHQASSWCSVSPPWGGSLGPCVPNPPCSCLGTAE